MQETWSSTSASRKEPGEGNSYPPRIVAWRIPWTGEPGIPSPGSKELQAWLSNWSQTHTHTCFARPSYIWKKKKLVCFMIIEMDSYLQPNLSKTERWSCGRSENTGESVLQGKGQHSCNSLSKDTWHETRKYKNWTEEKRLFISDLARKGHLKTHEPRRNRHM